MDFNINRYILKYIIRHTHTQRISGKQATVRLQGMGAHNITIDTVNLEHKQRESLRAITGCVATTNMSALYFNADTLPIASIIEERCIKGYLKDFSYPAICLLHHSGSSLPQAIYNTSVHNLTPKFVGTKILEYNPHKQRLKLAHKYNLKGLSLENSITIQINPKESRPQQHHSIATH